MKKPIENIELETILNGLPVKVVDLLEQSRVADIGGIIRLLWFAFQLMPTTARKWARHELTPENFNLLTMRVLNAYMSDKKNWSVDYDKLRLQTRD